MRKNFTFGKKFQTKYKLFLFIDAYMNRFLTYFSLLFLLTASCAQIGTLTGGEKDTEPPKVLKSTPKEQGRNFSGDKITITFDEFFQLENISSVFLSSPPLLEKPEFKIKRKSLVIELQEKLRDTSTYTFMFGDAIKDFHESNKLKNFNFVFSTGNNIDTMEVAGQVIDAKTHEKQKGMAVMLYRNYNDSTPIKEKPDYIARTDTAGKFSINYIKTGKYRIFALKDNDANLNFNLPAERIAYLNSFIIPTVKTETKIDSFKAGSVLHIGKQDTIGDTLRADTVIITEKYIYAPKDILLFSFTEDHNNQYLSGTERKTKEKCVFQFGKEIKNARIKGLDFELTPENSFTEKQDSGRSVVVWLKDKALYENDSLLFTASYSTKDSTGAVINKEDTAVCQFRASSDTLNTKLLFEEAQSDIDWYKSFELTTETPLARTDTSKIKLFLLYDTLVLDTKKQQLLTHIRPAPDTLVFSLQRPFVKTFAIEALNFDSVTNENFKRFSTKDTLLTFQITDPKIAQKDTLKFLLHYDNAFFMGQTQKFTDTLSLPLFKQKLVSADRPAQDTIVLTFAKKVSGQTSIEVNDKNAANWYTKIQSDNDKQLKLKLKNKDLIAEDTLMLTIRTNDYDNTLGEKIDFEYVKTCVFKHERQQLKKATRPQRNKLSLIFTKILDKDIKIRSLKKEQLPDAFKISYGKTKDTVFCTLTDPWLTQKDTLSIIAEYSENFKRKTIEYKDTLNLIYKRKRRLRQRQKKRSPKTATGNVKTTTNSKTKETVSIEIPVAYRMKADSLSERKYHIKRKWKEGASYVLKVDSLAFEDYFGRRSEHKEFSFNVRKQSDYGNIEIQISRIKRISDADFYSLNDSLSLDSLEYSHLSEGQLIFNLFDEKNNLLKTEYITQDTLISYNALIAGNYHAEIIYDKNRNKTWDTGNYLKNIQAERILYYPDKIVVKPSETNKITIEIKPEKFN